VLGNLDRELREFLGRSAATLVPFFAFAIGATLDLHRVWQAGLLGVALLDKIQHRQQHQTSRDYGQQCRLQAVEEICLHQRSTLFHSPLLHVSCHG